MKLDLNGNTQKALYSAYDRHYPQSTDVLGAY